MPRAPVTARAPVADRAGSIVPTATDQTLAALDRLAARGALVFANAIPLVVLLQFVLIPPVSAGHVAAVSAATAVYLPLHVRHVRYALRGARPSALPWTLATMTAAIVAVTPLLGAFWLYAFQALAASLLVSAPPRWSFPAVGCLLLLVGVWGHHLAYSVGAAQDIYLPAAVLDRAMTVFVLVWLLAALRRIQAARLALAEEALDAERRRVDDELRSTVGAQLEDVTGSGRRILTVLRSNSAAAEAELKSLVEGSRGALAEARRVIRRYKHVSSRVEVDTAASLLRAAGIDVRVELPEEPLPAALNEPARESLRGAVAQLLREGTDGPVVVRFLSAHGDLRVEAVAATSLGLSA
jgi:two-component system, NarL family, sensor histidine kinase DesK